MKIQPDSGATAMEYGILVAFIALAIVIAIGLFGDAIANLFEGFIGDMPFGG